MFDLLLWKILVLVVVKTKFSVNFHLQWYPINAEKILQPKRDQELDYYKITAALEKAFFVWSKHSRLTFKNVFSSGSDILIYFEKQQHGDGFPFDGRGKVLAHAFFPGTGRNGDIHFDEEEQWVLEDTDTAQGTSLFTVAAHEIGHSLGLSHSSVQGALMFPWYQGFKPNLELHEDDRDAIQALYGPKDIYQTPSDPPYRAPIKPTTRYTPLPPSPKYPKIEPSDPEKKPDTCDTSYDAISIIRGDLFIFKDKYFWRIGEKGLYLGYPNLINRLWSSLPSNVTHVDAVYERYDRKIVFFIGREVYLFHGNVLMNGFPKPLTALGLPSWLDHIDAAMVWGYNSKTYFFSGDLYWRFDEEVQHVELDYPRNMSIWKGISTPIDAAFQWKDGATYFFKGRGFWKFNDNRLKVYDKRQTPSAQFWMGCPKSLEDPHVPEGIDADYDVQVHTINKFYFSTNQLILIATSVIALILIIICITIYIKKRNSHSYIRPKRIKR